MVVRLSKKGGIIVIKCISRKWNTYRFHLAHGRVKRVGLANMALNGMLHEMQLYARSQNCEERLLASACLSVRQLDSHWTGFS